MDMDALTQKTTILFPPSLHQRLTRLAEVRGTSLGNLVRSACESQYPESGREERVEAARALRAMSLPVGSVKEMKAESIAPYKAV